MATKFGFVPDCLPSVKSGNIHPRAISQEILQSSVAKISLAITHLKLHSKLPGANELNLCPQMTPDCIKWYIGGLVQYCSISIPDALEILQSCTKPSVSNNANLTYARDLLAYMASLNCHWK